MARLQMLMRLLARPVLMAYIPTFLTNVLVCLVSTSRCLKRNAQSRNAMIASRSIVVMIPESARLFIAALRLIQVRYLQDTIVDANAKALNTC